VIRLRPPWAGNPPEEEEWTINEKNEKARLCGSYLAEGECDSGADGSRPWSSARHDNFLDGGQPLIRQEPPCGRRETGTPVSKDNRAIGIA